MWALCDHFQRVKTSWVISLSSQLCNQTEEDEEERGPGLLFNLWRHICELNVLTRGVCYASDVWIQQMMEMRQYLHTERNKQVWYYECGINVTFGFHASLCLSAPRVKSFRSGLLQHHHEKTSPEFSKTNTLSFTAGHLLDSAVSLSSSGIKKYLDYLLITWNCTNKKATDESQATTPLFALFYRPDCVVNYYT